MIIYGKRAVKQVLKNNKKTYKAYLYHHFKDQNIILELQKRNINIEFLSKKELDKIAKGNHQGIILDIIDYQFLSLEELLMKPKANLFIVILDHLEDPHNLGAIIRTCEAAGVDGIIIPKDRSATVNATVMKVSSGALEYVSIYRVANINDAIRKLKERGIWIIGTDVRDSVPYTTIDYNIPLALIIGNEEKGLSRLTKKLCDINVYIPMKGKINSLNASVAAAIIIYKIIEKRL